MSPGQIVVPNGAPRSGKSSIAAVIQETFEGLWVNLGVDVARSMTPARYQPGIGLRPGEAEHPAAPVVPVLFAALYESIAAHANEGVNVVADIGHHDVAVLCDCARRRPLSDRRRHGATERVRAREIRNGRAGRSSRACAPVATRRARARRLRPRGRHVRDEPGGVCGRDPWPARGHGDPTAFERLAASDS